ncbi:MAG: HTTM domain-containing protein [Flavobacteriales bacterium]|nr:HTTM domain-containing protein [Flavobacteriales bacterium]
MAVKYMSFKNFLEQSVSIAPLVSLRIIFGAVMLLSTLRYMYMGWVDSQLVDPMLHFSYYGFDWVEAVSREWMYFIFWTMALSSFMIIIGAWYRLASIIFFLCFTYVELVDITYYLNHYYFVSIISFLMILVPANSYLSLDSVRKVGIQKNRVSRWCILIFKIMLGIVYVYAGLAKINFDWLVNAMPLAIWLPSKSHIPIIGELFNYKLTAYVFSWAGMLFDTFIILGLLFKKTRWASYALVIAFHVMTGILFRIGIFPVVMIFMVLIFFSENFHENIITRISNLVGYEKWTTGEENLRHIPSVKNKLIIPLLTVFLLFQLVFPWRYLLYPGNLFWTEEGYRFSWRVMLMEKAGAATFYVKDGEDGREGSVINHQFLNAHQEKQMAMQPDLILQYAHWLKHHYKEKGMSDPKVRVEAWVTLNSRPARLLIDPDVNLTEIEDSWDPKPWILPYPYSN